MIRLCINCDTENPFDAVICSECGMSLTRAPTGESALDLREEVERARFVAPEPQLAPGQRLRSIARILALIWAGCWTVLIGLTAYFFGQMSSGVTYFGSYPYQPVWESTARMCLPLSPVLLIVWVSAVIPWRWERVGGAVLVMDGLLLFTLAVLAEILAGSLRLLDCLAVLAVFVTASLPPLLIGALFLASWRRSVRG